MSQVEWTPDLSVSDLTLDKQHQQFIKIVNDLIDARREGRDAVQLIGTLQEMLDYLRNHFSYEESVMQDSGFTGFDAHKKIHDTFSDNTKEMVSRYLGGQELPTEEVLVYLRDWFINHIKGVDQEYVPCLQPKAPE